MNMNSGKLTPLVGDWLGSLHRHLGDRRTGWRLLLTMILPPAHPPTILTTQGNWLAFASFPPLIRLPFFPLCLGTLPQEHWSEGWVLECCIGSNWFLPKWGSWSWYEVEWGQNIGLSPGYISNRWLSKENSPLGLSLASVSFSVKRIVSPGFVFYIRSSFLPAKVSPRLKYRWTSSFDDPRHKCKRISFISFSISVYMLINLLMKLDTSYM